MTSADTTVANTPTKQQTEADTVTIRDRRTTQSGDIRRHGQSDTVTLGDSDAHGQ